MRISPTKFIHSLLYTTPILLLTLASCGGGGGGSSTPALTVSYTIGGAASGVQATSPSTALVLRNNGGDDLTVASGVTSYTFPTALVAGTPYKITVLKNPSSPTQACTVANATGTASANVTNANVSCVTAYTVGGTTINNLLGTGLVLQNNNTDNLLIPPTASSFTFNTPIADPGSYAVTILTQPRTPAQTCALGNPSGTVNGGPVTSVTISCTTNVALPPADPYVYAANYGSANVSTFNSASGVLTPGTAATAGNGPSAIAVTPGGKFAYVTNYTSNTLAAYNIASGVLSATPIASIATGTNPRAVAIHPSGKFAYVANQSSNSISAYSIDANGALASIDADGGTTGTQATISTRSAPVSIAIDPSGSHAYVANAGTNDVSVYSIDSLTGALTAFPADGVTGHATYVTTGGTNPSSVVVDPQDQHLYVTNRGTSDDISIFTINSNGSLTFTSSFPAHVAGDYPVSIAIDPTGTNVYVVNNGSNTVSFYTATGTGSLIWVSSLPAGTTPISITMDSTGQYAYVANSGSNDISVYSVVYGTLNPISCTTGGSSVCNSSNFLAGTTPYSVVTSR